MRRVRAAHRPRETSPPKSCRRKGSLRSQIWVGDKEGNLLAERGRGTGEPGKLRAWRVADGAATLSPATGHYQLPSALA